MLMLSRHVGERIFVSVPPSTTTTIVAVTIADVQARAHRVKVGIDAPAETEITREELFDAETIKRMARSARGK